MLCLFTKIKDIPCIFTKAYNTQLFCVTYEIVFHLSSFNIDFSLGDLLSGTSEMSAHRPHNQLVHASRAYHHQVRVEL